MLASKKNDRYFAAQKGVCLQHIHLLQKNKTSEGIPPNPFACPPARLPACLPAYVLFSILLNSAGEMESGLVGLGQEFFKFSRIGSSHRY